MPRTCEQIRGKFIYGGRLRAPEPLFDSLFSKLQHVYITTAFPRFKTCVMAFSIQFWVNYTHERVKLQRKSEQAVANDRVLSFHFDTDCRVVNANVQASMKDKTYKVQVSLAY